MDIFPPEKRSEIMSRIRGKNTKPEILVYRYLSKNKIYFQKHYRSKQKIVIDVALPRKKRAVFIDGDFWHGRTIAKLIQRRGADDYWTKKIQRNIQRDIGQRNLLTASGWSILRIWESDLMRKSEQHDELKKITDFLTSES